uniref:RRM domain-containing protein n=1 Tax=Brassica oleracea var. oleracea TaxID=109376 RepID=A0A0D3CYF0_BRAOL
MLVPYYIVGQKLRLKMVICMRRLEEEKEVEEDKEDEAEDEAEEEEMQRLKPLSSHPLAYHSETLRFIISSDFLGLRLGLDSFVQVAETIGQWNTKPFWSLTELKSTVFSFSFVSSGQRELSDEFNTKLNLENQNEESDEKMHMKADYSSSSDSSSDDSDSEEEEGPVNPQPQPQPPRSTTTGGSRTLFAGNLALQVKKSDIKEFFQEAGEVVDVKFGMGRDDGSFRGFGHILFASPVEAQMALGFQGRTLLGRQIRLYMALESSETRRFIQAAQASDKVPHIEMESLANYVAVILTVVEYSFLRLMPSLIAASAVFFSKMDAITIQNPTLKHYTRYETHALKNTVLALEEDSFAYDLQLNTSGSTLVAIRKKYNQEKFGSTEMNRIQKVAFQTPQEDFMSIPSYLNPQAIVQNLRICIHRLEEEEEEEEETVDDLLILIRLLVEEEEAVEADDVNNVRRSTREKKANSKYQNKVK